MWWSSRNTRHLLHAGMQVDGRGDVQKLSACVRGVLGHSSRKKRLPALSCREENCMAAKKKTKPAKLTVNGVVEDVLKRRAQALRARMEALAALPAPTAAAPAAAVKALTKKHTAHFALAAAAVSPAVTKGFLIAEGDSWFENG